MKKIPFYNPASPLFFHIAVAVLYVFIFLIFLPLPGFSIFYVILIFSAVYPFFALLMTILVRKAYINTYQTPVPEEFADKLVLYNRYFITAIYVFSLGVGFVELETVWGDIALLGMFFLFVLGLCFLFYLYILPIIIRLILLKKTSFILEVIILGIFFLLFLSSLYIIRSVFFY